MLRQYLYGSFEAVTRCPYCGSDDTVVDSAF